jgi:hypothetical protein
MPTFINLTPHVVRLFEENTPSTIYGDVDTHPKLICRLVSVGQARVPFDDNEVDRIGPVPVMEPVFGSPSGLPDPQEGVVYITSLLVAQNTPGRTDVLAPVRLVRDEDNRVVGCRALTRGKYP